MLRDEVWTESLKLRWIVSIKFYYQRGEHVEFDDHRNRFKTLERQLFVSGSSVRNECFREDVLWSWKKWLENGSQKAGRYRSAVQVIISANRDKFKPRTTTGSDFEINSDATRHRPRLTDVKTLLNSKNAWRLHYMSTKYIGKNIFLVFLSWLDNQLSNSIDIKE